MSEAVRLRGLTYNYPDGTRGLRDVDLDVAEGEILAVVGPNGGGKSTLLMHLNGLLTGIGSVRVLGLEMKRENLSAIRRGVGYVFQDPQDQLFMPTLKEDVAFGPRNLGLPEGEIERRVLEALRQVGLEGKQDVLCHHMSLGEQRRAAIATVLSMDPRLMVFDEPNSSLDPAARRHLIRLMKGLPLTQVLATHDLEMVLDVAGRAVLMDGGRIIAEGEPRLLFADAALMDAHGLEVPHSLLPHR